MKTKILIIDDDENAIALLALILKKEGYEVLHALDSASGMATAEIEQPDLILLDIMMPGVDGFQTCQMIKENPKIKEIPILFLSALTDSQDKIKGLELGGVDFVTKGGDKGELLARVRTQLKIRALTKEIVQTNEILVEKQHHLDEDLKAAAVIQHTLLPHPNLVLPKTEIAWKFEPCELIGGDVFNATQPTPNHVAFYILDVSGHGVPSAMVSASVSETLLQISYKAGRSQNLLIKPKLLMESLQKEFPIERFDRFFTLAYLVLDAESGKLTYSNAGHPPPILLRSTGSIELLDIGGPLIGFGENMLFEEGEEMLHKGDKIILYTDGITEREDQKGTLYGDERLLALAQQMSQKPIQLIIDEIFARVADFGNHLPLKDDVSLFGIQFTGDN